LAVTQHDSIFKNIQLPGGISTKATEYKDLAAKGDKWESPIFSIGSAKETSSLPKVANVTRKPHGRAGGYGTEGTSGAGLGASQGINPAQNAYQNQYDGTSGFGQNTGAGLTGSGLTGNTGSGLTGTHGTGSGLTGTHGTGSGLTGGLPGSTGQTGGTGFAGQVDNAFNNPVGGTAGNTGLGSTTEGTHHTGAVPPAQPGTQQYNTTFGDQNPVFQGKI